MRIFLIGFMGSGKSWWAPQLGAQLGMPHYDLDEEIEKAEGMTTQELFAQKGEAYFRQRESEVLKAWLLKDDYVMACGGGTPCFFGNMELMLRQGVVVWLKADAAVIKARLLGGRAHRPLIQNMNETELETFIAAKLTERDPFYRLAHLIVEDTAMPVEQMTELIRKSGNIKKENIQ
jgi:shikimate kinase